MAQFAGKNGILKSGATQIGEIRSFTIDESSDVAESTSMGDSARSYIQTLTQFSGTIDAYLDFADSGQDTLTIGSSVTANFFPDGESTGDVKLSGTIIVTGVSKTQSFDGIAEVSFSFQGTGALTESTA